MSLVRPLQSPLLVGRDDLLELAERRIAEAAAGRGHLLILAGRGGHRQDAAPAVRSSARPTPPGSGSRRATSRRRTARCRSRRSSTSPGRCSRVGTFGTLGDDLLALAARQGRATGSRSPRARPRDRGPDPRRRSTGRPCSPSTTSSGPTSSASRSSASSPRRGRQLPAAARGGLPAGRAARGLDPPRVARAAAQPAARRGGPARAADATSRPRSSTTLILGTGLPARARWSSAVYERTDGIPLHIEELLAALGDDGAHATAGAIRDAHVPDTIEDAVLARYGRLSPDARAVARAGCRDRPLLRPRRARRAPGPAASPTSTRPLEELVEQLVPVPVRVPRPRLLRLPPPAAARRAVRHRPGRRAPAAPRPRRRVRRDPRRRVRGPRVAPLRARRAPRARRTGRRWPVREAAGRDVEPARGVRALPAGRRATCRRTCRPASSRALRRATRTRRSPSTTPTTMVLRRPTGAPPLPGGRRSARRGGRCCSSSRTRGAPGARPIGRAHARSIAPG